MGLYSIRQYFSADGRFLRYESKYPGVKDNQNDAVLPAGVSQQILKVVDRPCRAFFNLQTTAIKVVVHHRPVVMISGRLRNPWPGIRLKIGAVRNAQPVEHWLLHPILAFS